MTFISYAQNFEDVMLWRALKHVECGFYVDVGANDPEVDSVTKAFYDRGWRGINIEPVTQWYEKLQAQRTRDINLKVAAGEAAGELVLYEIPDTGLSTMDRATAERHEVENGYEKIEIGVPVRSLTEICLEYHESPIQFLKIDVEGAEGQVLAGLDLSRIRPWILLVESTLPNTQTEDFKDWEPAILAADYEYVYFDGLNRFYVAAEHAELKNSFAVPPNFFDQFVGIREVASERRARSAEAQMQQLEQQAVGAETRALQMEQRAMEAEALARQFDQRAVVVEGRARQLEQAVVSAEERMRQAEEMLSSLIGSHSWRMTRPLRLFVHLIRTARNRVLLISSGCRNALKGLLKALLSRAISFVVNRPALKNRLVFLVRKYPQVDAGLRRFAAARGLIDSVSIMPAPDFGRRLDQLSPRARQIYMDLKAATDRHQKVQ